MGNLGCGCSGSMVKVIERPVTDETNNIKAVSELRQWPVQLHLVPPTAPYFKDAEILVCADCVAFAMGSMHQDLLKGKALAIACPKLDNTGTYVDKLATIFSTNETPRVTVAIMEVPCCKGLDIMVEDAIQKSGRDIPLETVVIGIDGNRRN
ncbi:MAG: iron-sulfur cluster-binding oxidoreductase [Geobacteraceae bacterium]|nr:iron-sulfur cluster-binding oxidoreductase [Geobacteraceae bacterium]NTW79247.1 iron-sulfur cluster-binding oxidoreductase [Geobacteraceae bacterium]